MIDYNKVYLVLVDHDMSMRSMPTPENIFKNKKDAVDYLYLKYKFKWDSNKLGNQYEIKEMELR